MEISQDSGLEKSRVVLLGALFLMAWLFLQPARAENAGESGNNRMTVKFKSNCASCHGTDGAGTPLGKSMNAPDLRSAEVQKHSDAELACELARLGHRVARRTVAKYRAVLGIPPHHERAAKLASR